MERTINIEEVRNFLAAADKQFVKGGIALSRIKFIRNEDMTLKEILMQYDTCEVRKEEQP